MCSGCYLLELSVNGYWYFLDEEHCVLCLSDSNDELKPILNRLVGVGIDV